MPDAVICEPLRTPVGGFGGGLPDVAPQTLAATVIRELVSRTGVTADQIDDAESMSGATYYSQAPRWGTKAGGFEMKDALAEGRVHAGGRNHPVWGGMIETAENVGQRLETMCIGGGQGLAAVVERMA